MQAHTLYRWLSTLAIEYRPFRAVANRMRLTTGFGKTRLCKSFQRLAEHAADADCDLLRVQLICELRRKCLLIGG